MKAEECRVSRDFFTWLSAIGAQMLDSFDLQGHRGARGLKPENTLPAFEAALDALVSSIETDVHLTNDGVPILCHDDALTPSQARVIPGANVPQPMLYPKVSVLSLKQLRGYLVDLNPDPDMFGRQSNAPTPVAQAYTKERGIPLYGVPTLEDLFAFVAAYGGRIGRQAKKTEMQRRQANLVRFNLELKRVPFRPEQSGEIFTGSAPGNLEKKVLETARAAGMLERLVIQSFDHRILRIVRALEPKLRTAVLIAGTAPVFPVHLVEDAMAQVYSPEFTFLDTLQVQQLHDAGFSVVPYTVNETSDMARLLTWGVDGIITDYPDRLVPLLKARHLRFV
jgi:glycerophosphoryl diester phosphodiesterase